MSRFLPILTEGHEVSYGTEISGRAVRCTFTWLERTASWYLDVAKPDGTLIVRGRRISGSRPPLEGLRILHIIGDVEGLIVIGNDPYPRQAPPIAVLVLRPPALLLASGLSVVKIS